MKRYSIPIFSIALVRDGSAKIENRPQITGTESAYEILKDWFLDKDREEFIILMLNAKNRVIGINTVSIGSLTASLVHPREVLKPLILHNAAAVIFAHNHPSGDPIPSQEDRNMTERLVLCANLFGIRAVDHIVIGHDCYYSFADHDEMTTKDTFRKFGV